MNARLARTALLALPVLAGCAEMPQNMPLVFAETISVGIGVGATTVDQGASFNLGFQSKDVAIVPVVSYDKAGNAQMMRADNSQNSGADKSAASDGKNAPEIQKQTNGTQSQDAFSVLGTFSSETSGTAKTVGLGKFFATGAAAQRLAEGLSKSLAAAPAAAANK